MTISAFYDDLAGAIADGAPIDWTAAESSDGIGGDGLVSRLRLIASIAALHRGPAPADSLGTPHAIEADDSKRWGHLQLREQIGRGAFGVVYRAWDERIDREVALKLLPVRARPDGGPGAAIIEEGRALARVRHPNVVTLHGAAEIDGRMGLWMELIQGCTVDQLIEQGKRWSPREAAALGVELCRAVSAVHAAGLLHRDIKASNVMVADDGRVVLMDFGTGRLLDEDGGAAPAGTPIYLAPEVFAGAEPTPASDVYSVGVVLFRLLTGSYPVKACDVDALRRAHQRGERARLANIRPRLPNRLVNAIDRTLAPDPQHRYSTADALAADLVPLTSPPRLASRAPAFALAAMLPIVVGGWWLVRGLSPQGPESSEPSSRPGPASIAGVVPAPTGERTIAVLPFETTADPKELAAASGAGPTGENLAEGIADELIRDLGRVEGLVVRSRHSSLAVAMTPRNLRQIGERLGADLILTGTVLRSGEQLRISAQLIDAANENQLWSDRFDRKLASTLDVFGVVDEIAHAIVNELRLTIGSGRRRYDTDVETYELYLRARHLAERLHPRDTRHAAELFEWIIERDPDFAPAHAGLADVYYTMSLVTGLVDRDVALGVMKRAAGRALELDPLLPEAYAARGAVHALQFEWEPAEAAFRHALELGPTLTPISVQFVFSTLLPLGRTDEADRLLQSALQRDPLSEDLRWTIGMVQFFSDRYRDAVQTLEPLYEADPDLPFLRILLARCYTFANRLPEAFAMFDELDVPHYETHALVRAGRRAEVEQIAADCEDPFFAVIMWAALGDAERTLAALEIEERGEPQQIPLLLVAPELAVFRGDPRFDDLRRRLDLPLR